MLMVLIAAVARACHMVQALIDVVMVAIYTHQAMAVIIYLVVVMLVEALSHHQCIRVGVWAAMVTWVVEYWDLDPTIENLANYYQGSVFFYSCNISRVGFVYTIIYHVMSCQFSNILGSLNKLLQGISVIH